MGRLVGDHPNPGRGTQMWNVDRDALLANSNLLQAASTHASNRHAAPTQACPFFLNETTQIHANLRLDRQDGADPVSRHAPPLLPCQTHHTVGTLSAGTDAAAPPLLVLLGKNM